MKMCSIKQEIVDVNETLPLCEVNVELCESLKPDLLNNVELGVSGLTEGTNYHCNERESTFKDEFNEPVQSNNVELSGNTSTEFINCKESEISLELQVDSCDPLDEPVHTNNVDLGVNACSPEVTNSHLSKTPEQIFEKYGVLVTPCSVLLEKLDVQKLQASKKIKVQYNSCYFQCKTCLKCFKTERGTQIHATRYLIYNLNNGFLHQNFQKIDVCNKCFFKTHRTIFFQNHICTVTNYKKNMVKLKSYSCKLCFEISATLYNMTKHLNLKHNIKTNNNYKSQANWFSQCFECFDLFTSQILLDKHSKNCPPEQITVKIVPIPVNFTPDPSKNICLNSADRNQFNDNTMNLCDDHEVNTENNLYEESETVEHEEIHNNDQMRSLTFDNNIPNFEFVDTMPLKIKNEYMEPQNNDQSSVKFENIDEMLFDKKDQLEFANVERSKEFENNGQSSVNDFEYIDVDTNHEDNSQLGNSVHSSEEFENSVQNSAALSVETETWAVNINHEISKNSQIMTVQPQITVPIKDTSKTFLIKIQSNREQKRLINMCDISEKRKNIEYETPNKGPAKKRANIDYETPSERAVTTWYNCTCCDVSLRSRMEFMSHLELAHKDYDIRSELLMVLYECNKCHVKLRDEKLIQNHVCKAHISEMVSLLGYQCFLCPLKFLDECNCLKHICKEHKFNDTNYALRRCHISNVQCKKCYVLCTNMITLKGHIYHVHSKKKSDLVKSVQKDLVGNN